MSLYEQFHSDINKNYMFDMIKDIIKKEIEVDISSDESNKEYYLSTFEPIFKENDLDDIADMNKILLDHHIEYFIRKFKQPEKDIQNEYEKLLQDRENSLNKTSERTNITDINNLQIEEEVKEVEDVEEEQIVEKVEKVKKEKEYKTVNINSSQRTNINSSRFNYKVDLFKKSIQSNEIKNVSKVILPIEDNYIFSIPVINITIPELNCNILMQQEKVIETEHRKYGIFESLDNHTIRKRDVPRITINIKDVTGKKYNYSDILKVNIVEIKDNIILFTCSNIRSNDYQVNDYIKVINNNTFQLLQALQNPLKIEGIKDNIIVCHLDIHIDDGTYNNIDMKIMNMSNQNIVYFN